MNYLSRPLRTREAVSEPLFGRARLLPSRRRGEPRLGRSLALPVLKPPRVIYLVSLVFFVNSQPLCGASVALTATKDTTLYEYHPDDANTSLNSNGSGDFFSAGRSLQRSQIRRGLLQFDFSTIPAGAELVEGSVQLQLYVVDVPRKDPSSRPIWLVPAPDGFDWGEGASATNAGVSGAGSGAPAEPGDATWFHTMYDPQIHDQVTFVPNGQGFWQQPGAG